MIKPCDPNCVLTMLVAKQMSPYGNRLRLQLDWRDTKTRQRFADVRNEMTNILVKKKIRPDDARRAVVQTLDIAVDHQLDPLRRDQDLRDLSRWQKDLGRLIKQLDYLRIAISKLPPSTKGKLNKIAVDQDWQSFDTETFTNLTRALTRAGYPVHWVTVARWHAQNWQAKPSNHPLEIARAQLEAIAPLVTDDPETTLDDLIGQPGEEDLGELSDDELLRKAAREVAIATNILAKEIARRAALPETELVELAPILRAVAAGLDALPEAFQQALALKRARERPSYEGRLCTVDLAQSSHWRPSAKDRGPHR
jgi:hypothetical protein